jgi:hypothetical protein
MAFAVTVTSSTPPEYKSTIPLSATYPKDPKRWRFNKKRHGWYCEGEFAVFFSGVHLFSGGPYFDKWFSDEQVLSIISGWYDLSNILPGGIDTAKALTFLNSANTKNPFLSGIDNRHGSESGVYRMSFTVYNTEKVRKNRKFYYMCIDKSDAPLPLTLGGAQFVYDRVVRSTSRKRARLVGCDDDVYDDNINSTTLRVLTTAHKTLPLVPIVLCYNQPTLNRHTITRTGKVQMQEICLPQKKGSRLYLLCIEWLACAEIMLRRLVIPAMSKSSTSFIERPM